MRRLILILALMLIAVPVGAEDSRRSLNLDKPAAGISAIVLEAGVGDVEVTADESGRITAQVEVEAKNGSHWWGSSRSRGSLDQVELTAEVKGDRLHLRVDRPGEHHDRQFGENWTIHIPAGVGVEIQLGVGELRIFDVGASVDVEVGVGDIRIEGSYDAFGAVNAECGVGDATVHTPEGREDGHGFIAHELSTRGPGKAKLDAEAGVGDVEIRLR
jgi:hypothetical protein